MGLTHGALLGGRLRYAQPESGHRTGIEPVLLAAAVPARPGQRVIEAGAGAGAALLCLAHRVPGIEGVGVEKDPAMADLAADNAAANRLAVRILAADVLALPEIGQFDHAMANPPWHGPAGTPSPDPGRNLAKRGRPGVLAAWMTALARTLRFRGTLTVIIPAGLLDEAFASLRGAGLGSPALLPLWPRQGAAAKLVMFRAVRGGAGPCRLLPGLALHDGDGRYTGAASGILEGEATMPGLGDAAFRRGAWVYPSPNPLPQGEGA